MCEGEFESLKAIDKANPGFCPKPYAWGKYAEEDPETYFILEEFREIERQVQINPSTLLASAFPLTEINLAGLAREAGRRPR